MTKKYTIDLKQDKEKQIITIEIKNYPMLMGDQTLALFAGCVEGFLRVFYEQYNKHVG